jgi:excisionase family DNA binding protein
MQPKTQEQFRRWLISELKRLGKRKAETEVDFSGGVVVEFSDKPLIDEVSEFDFEDAAETVQRAGEFALQARLPDAYKIASEVTTPMLALNTARTVLIQMLQTIPPKKDTNGAMSVRQVADQLGVSKETVYAMCRDGRLPCTRIGRRVTITPEQLKSYQSGVPASVGALRHLS